MGIRRLARGATAALIAGIWLFGGWTYAEWEELAAQDPERQVYFQEVVQPAYQQYQQDPSSVPVRESAADELIMNREKKKKE